MTALKACNIKTSKSQLKKKDLQIKLKDKYGKETIKTFSNLVEETRKTGVVPEVDRILWIKTNHFGTVAAATDANNFPAMKIQTGIRNSEALKAPGYITNNI